ncbi:MAG: MBG domain-containing protein, partial [Kiritimatiellae bacterium]|nr:MBG domain-containing protein [Kiritimatiellia bacterium]
MIGPCALPILMAIAMIASPGGVFAGTTNSTLTNFYDNFETYTNGTPLIYGTNGWYGSSSNIIVQINTVRTGTNAAMIPVDCTLSNRFETNAPSTNIWLQMDLRAVFYDGTNPPIVDTNMAAMFYINSNGYFMVHNGPATNPSPTNSLSWVVATNNVQISTNGTNWVRINIYEDFSQINWDLYSDGVLVTNTIGFINTNLTNFAGFDIYNGSMTSYLDNVSVAAMNTNQFPVIVIPSALSTNVFAGKTAGGKTFKVRNVWVTDVDYKVQTNQTWVTASPVVGPVLAYETNTVTLTFADTENWAAGAYNATVSVVATNTDDGEYDTQTVAVVINIMNMQVAPTSLSNSSYVGLTPTSQSFQVINAGAGSFNYTGAITNDWILSCTPSNGTVEAFATNLITVTYSNSITNWAVGATSNTTITIASTNGGGATQTVSVALNVVMRDQTITFPAISDQITTNTVGLSATASSSLTVSFAVESGPGEIPVLTNLTFTNSGSVSITASQAGDAQYNPAPNVTNTFNVTKAIAAVTLNNLNQTYDGSAMTVTATTVPAGQTVDITYDGNSWAPTNVGSYAVSGTVNEPMYQGFQVGTLVVTNKALSLVGMTASNKVYDGNTTAIISSYGTTNGIVGSDDVAVDYSGASAAFDTANVGVGKTVTLSSLALSGTAATNYSITNQTTTADITIVTNNTITFLAIPAQPLTNGTLTLSASASSGLPVSFTNISGPGTIVGDVITFTGVGEIAVTASQTGNVNYVAAVSVTRTFPVYGFSPMTNVFPFTDTFETYFNLEPLINGTNGWYGSSADIIVQTNIFAAGTKAAKLPVD